MCAERHLYSDALPDVVDTLFLFILTVTRCMKLKITIDVVVRVIIVNKNEIPSRLRFEYKDVAKIVVRYSKCYELRHLIRHSFIGSGLQR